MLFKKVFIYLFFSLGVVGCSLSTNVNCESKITTSTFNTDELIIDTSSFQTSYLNNNSENQTYSSSLSSDQQSSSDFSSSNSSIPSSSSVSFGSSVSSFSSSNSSESSSSSSSESSASLEWNLCVDMQDGCIYNDYFFMFNSSASCSIYYLLDKSLVASVNLPDYNGWLPHSNSAFFGKKYVDSDPFPLLYTNVYNNYAFNRNTFGMCFVYRISFDTCFAFELVQIVKVGFIDDFSMWYNNSFNLEPYGNFFINNDDLWIYVGISGSSITRFFKTKLPDVNYNCEEVDFRIIANEDICSSFDTQYFHYPQGNTVFLNKLFSIEGCGQDDTGYLRIVDLETTDVESYNLNQLFNRSSEPECIDVYNGYLLIGFYYWKIYFLPLNNFGFGELEQN